MESRYFPVNFNELKAEILFEAINHGKHPIGDARFSFIENNHPGTAYGFKVTENGRDLIFITDNELLPLNNRVTRWDEFVAFCRNADILIHDAQFLDNELNNTTGFGHSSFEQTLKLGLESNVKQLIFFHHNPSRKDDEIDHIIGDIQHNLKKINSNIVVCAAREGQEIII